MRPARPLLFLSLANLALATVLCCLHPHQSEFSLLRSIAHINLRRDDSASFLQAACTAAHTGTPLYRTLFFAQHLKFIYPPSSLFTCDLAQALHLRLATLINLLALLSIPLTYVLDGELFLTLCPAENPRQRQLILALIASLGLFFSPLVYAAYLGQVQALLDLVFTFAVYAWLRGHRVLPGLAVALICVFKPPLAFFLLWALLRKQWRFLFAFAGAALLLQLLSIGRFGWHNELDYLAVLSFLSHHGEVLAGNQSVNGMLERWTGNGLAAPYLPWTRTSPYPPYNTVVYLGTVIAWAVLLLFGFLYPRLRRWKDSATDFLLFGLLATVASPIAWTHHYGLFYAGCIYFLGLALRQKRRIPLPFVLCFLVLANTWNVLDRFLATRWNPVLSFDLYAGLGILLALVFHLDHTRPVEPAPAQPLHC